MPRPSSAPDLLVEALRPHVEAALQGLPDGRQTGQRGHRATRVRTVCALLAARNVRPTVPLVRAFVTSGSPNDINADIRQWQLDAGKRKPLIDLAGEGLQDIAATLESVALEVVGRAREAARRELTPEREALLLARHELDDRARASERVVEQARGEANEARALAVALESKLAVEAALRDAAEQAAAETAAQRDALATRLAHAEERLAGLGALAKESARLETELVKRATEIERLRARIEVLSEARVKHELVRRDLQHARTRLSDLEKRGARLARELERTRERLAIAKARNPATRRAKQAARPRSGR